MLSAQGTMRLMVDTIAPRDRDFNRLAEVLLVAAVNGSGPVVSVFSFRRLHRVDQGLPVDGGSRGPRSRPTPANS